MGKKKTEKNYLDLVPVRKADIDWSGDDNGLVTLQIKNKGVFNLVAQKLFKKPPITYIHLDENGSFVWPLIDGERDVNAIGKLVDEHFGEKAHPLYERLVQFFRILENYKFITFKE